MLDDLRVRVRRADEVEEAHAVPPDVVEEETLALDEALVLLARDGLAGPAPLGLLLLGRRRLVSSSQSSALAFRTASTMFT